MSQIISGNLLDPHERQSLLQESLATVHYFARRIHERLPPHVPLEDLVHAGVIGLIDAVDRFDPTKNVPLKSYAKFRIRGAILDSLRAADWSPRSLRRQARRVRAAEQQLSQQMGRSPSETEIAEHLEMDLCELQRLLCDLRRLSVGSLAVRDGGDAAEENALASSPDSFQEDPFVVCFKSELKSLLLQAMKEMEERESQVLALYYFEELTMKEVGALLGIGESRVSQIHSLAMDRLRARLQELLGTRPTD